MTKIDRKVPLIVIDVQKAFNDAKWGRRSNPEAETNVARLLEAWRISGRPILHIRHSPRHEQSLFHPLQASSGFKPEAIPREDEPVLVKYVNSAFIGTDLQKRLTEMGCEKMVICGFTINHCVETTTRMAGNLGFQPILVSDAAAAFDRTGPDGKVYLAEDIHQMTLVNLHDEFAEIWDTNTVLERLA